VGAAIIDRIIEQRDAIAPEDVSDHMIRPKPLSGRV
jgi:hypothetical protein